jgi:hypothetical protein
MANLPYRTTKEVIDMTHTQLGYSSIRSVALATRLNLFLHISFAALLIANDYILDMWTQSVRPQLPLGWEGALYIIVPIALLLYGFWALWPLRGFIVNKNMYETSERTMYSRKRVNNLQVTNLLCFHLLLVAGAMVITLEDHFVSHMVILFFWSIFVHKTKTVIGPWA